MGCRYGVGEAGIVWEVTLSTVNDDGETVAFSSQGGDTHEIEFRRPDGTMVRRTATYAGGKLEYDQLNDTALLDQPGEWSMRGVITREGGAVIKSPWFGRFWVGA